MIRVPADCLLVHVAYLFYSIQKMDFEEFCVAAISVDQLEGMESWDLLGTTSRHAYKLFEKDGNISDYV